MSSKRNPQDWQMLSAYMDGALSPRQRAVLETRLDSEPELMQTLLQLQQTRRILRSIPRKRLPKSFTLTPAMVGKHSRTPLFSALRFSSIAAAALSVLLAVFGLLPQLTRMPVSTAPMSYEAAVTDEATFLAATEAPAEAAPPIIQWGQQPGTGETAGGMGGGDGNFAADAMPNDAVTAVEQQPTIVAEVQPSDPRLMPTATPAMGFLAPPPAETPAPSTQIPVRETAMPESPALPTVTPKEYVDNGTQPILGIAPSEERGQVTAPTAPPTPETSTQGPTNTQNKLPFRLWLIWGIVLSGALSLVFAFAAWRIRQR